MLSDHVPTAPLYFGGLLVAAVHVQAYRLHQMINPWTYSRARPRHVQANNTQVSRGNGRTWKGRLESTSKCVLETTLWITGVTDKRTISTSHDGSRWRDDLKSMPLHAAIEKEMSDSRGVLDVIQQLHNVSEKK